MARGEEAIEIDDLNGEWVGGEGGADMDREGQARRAGGEDDVEIVQEDDEKYK